MAVEAVDALSDVLSAQPVSAISPSTRILPGHQHRLWAPRDPGCVPDPISLLFFQP